MTAFAIKHEYNMVAIECYRCGVVFGVPAAFDRKRLADKESFWCPNGHSQAYVTSEADRLRKMLEEANRKNTTLADNFRIEQAAKERAEKEVKRVRSRVQRGVCTCCNRTFANLAKHMQTKHPEAVK